MGISQTDDLVFQFINHMAVTFSTLNPFMRFLSEKAEYLFYLGIIVYWFTRIHKNRQMVITTLFSACVGFGLGSILSHFFYRDRPFVHDTVNQLIEHSANASFPSDHSIGAFVIATGIGLFHKKDGVIWLVLAGLISFSRIWNGVHYPSDVITGAFIGVISALMIYQMVHRWSVAYKCLNVGIDLYEKIEKKIWINYKKDRSSNLKN
ncbi:undecaprenyl-diphosphatase [Paenibacillus sp. IHBB 10380]|uniref:undecaprenyl-diphosphatase n=1 Tax=Paenibacillus sp. IHBB 10380 TaxID=1566358 RepID=UPI000A691C30|nr:undecaprenyl-diphosphatase [Paenibacillus sp. IHBB 10380]